MPRHRPRRLPLWQWCLTCLLLLALPLKGLAASGLAEPVAPGAEPVLLMMDGGPCPHAAQTAQAAPGEHSAQHMHPAQPDADEDGSSPHPAPHCAPCCGGMALHRALVWRTEAPPQPGPQAGPLPHDASVTPARQDRPPTASLA